MKELLDLNKLPQHIAIIMDGNGRWAKQRGAQRVFGHQQAITSVRECTELCAEVGVKYLTLYTFSSENWNRPKYEVEAIMRLLISTIRKETKTLNDNNVRLQAIGNIGSLPGACQRELAEAIELTKDNTAMTLSLALSYGGRQELVDAVRRIADKVANGELQPSAIEESTVAQHLYTGRLGIPDPELLIRTSGEHRVSNFLLWQMAYAEFYFTNKLWPDFKKPDLIEAILSFQNRERRFGKTSEQIVSS